MFGLKSKGSNDPKNTKIATNKNNQKVNFSEDDFKIDPSKIHTMKKDLAELKNPPKKKTSFDSSEKKEVLFSKKTDSSENKGPFFQEKRPQQPPAPKKKDWKIQKEQEISHHQEEKEIYPPKVAKIKKTPLHLNKTKKPSPESSPKKNDYPENLNTTSIKKESDNYFPDKKISKKSEEEFIINTKPHSHGIGKAIAIAVILFVILIGAAGGYYFWMTRISSVPEEFATTEINNPKPEPETILSDIVPMPDLSPTNVNYLTINTTDTNPEKFKKSLSEYIAKVSKTDTVGAFQFLITDENNTPITFKDFSDMLGIDLSADIYSLLNPDFSFYIYNYGDKTRFGLSVTITDASLLKSTFTANESSLIQYFAPLYPDIDYTLPLESFTNATYAGAPEAYIRYINITNSEDLSLDYAIFNNQLIIGTTKSTAYSILDNLTEKMPSTKQ